VLKNVVKIPIQDYSREEWLELRRGSVGGSDAAGIVGLSKWAGAYSIWADKMGLLPEREQTEAMRQGTDLEEYVARRWKEESGKKVRSVRAVLMNPEYPFAHANIDRYVVGEDSGLECKTTSMLNLKTFEQGDYPAQYYCQCVHYMAVTGAKRWYLAVLVLGKDFFMFTIERDENEIKALMKREREFWRYVESGEPPPVDGMGITTEVLQEIYSEGSGGEIELFGRDKLIGEYYRHREIRDSAESEMEFIKQTLMADLGENETGLSNSYRVTWTPQNRRTFDVKRFGQENPDIDLEGYYRTSSSRVFRIKEI